MDLDGGALARIDRMILSGLGRYGACRMNRVPRDGAVRSTWRRYCDAVGISMGRAISELMKHELRSVVDDIGDVPVCLAKLENRLDERQVALDAREERAADRKRWMEESEGRLNADPRSDADVPDGPEGRPLGALRSTW